MGLRHLILALREEDLEQRRTLRHRGRLRHRAAQAEDSPPPSSEELSTFDLGGRTFEDRQSAAAFSTLVGRGGLKGKVLDHIPPVPLVSQDGGPSSGLRGRAALEDRVIPGGVASKFGIRPAENR